MSLAKPVGAPRRTLAQAYEEVGRHAPGFDTLRILAALLVVVHHTQGYDPRVDILTDDLLFRIGAGYTTIGFFAVCIFFAISGFLVTPGLTKTGNVIGYLSRRFMRIMPLLLVVVLATVFIVGPLATSLPLQSYFSDPQTWLYLKNVTTSLSLQLPGVVNEHGGDTVNGPLWTLRYEWLCYIALAVLSAVGLLRKRILVAGLWLAAIAFASAMYVDQTDPGNQPIMFAHLFSYFACGVLLYLFRDRIPASPYAAIAAAALLVASWASGTGTVFAPALTGYLVAMLGLVRWPWSGLLAKADLSYGIYLMHAPSIIVVLALWSPSGPWALFAATLALTIPLAALSWFALEKPALAHKTLPEAIFRRLAPAKLVQFADRPAG